MTALERMLQPNTVSDWLDRRAGLENESRRAEGLRIAQEWLAKNHPLRGAGQ